MVLELKGKLHYLVMKLHENSTLQWQILCENFQTPYKLHYMV